MKRIVILCLLSAFVFAESYVKIDNELASVSDFSSLLLQVTPTAMGERIDTGYIYFSRPNVKIELMREHILLLDGTMFLYNETSKDGYMGAVDELVIFSENPLQNLSGNYDIKVEDEDTKWCVYADAKQDANIMRYVIEVDKKLKIPVYIETHNITGAITIFRLEEIKKDKVPKAKFELPDDIIFDL